ncbi:DEAD/DEAH box helicase [Pyrenophora tritici-repentis]|uniref:ATP-dependent RNA helicase n=3 Tax=Pyrenophora tritici-repentis TaxID=45151 RepID=A0A922NDB9_9PLEO|nr:ATP-dependent RNA helicase MSS116, mitochondrial precursor [Pyrenophora tritici-repentis Pt-1C-BFP]EDU40617.1 ATP-dependent RNA helicase MSS116, mitochondrial precursor [Pyrenophora tritici-repentis Pt-1C-BFP]KAI1513285.1 DEAD/DEAH box helicase [Pyrenophora tritici-repentis]KAI1674583.1 DEAD/DEAH box helicase [Pyrenophora tritici-repentis]KAI1688297.1 DEAD/DEAH box helicase [Pyrenophora tritici-repentis]
MPPPPKRKWPRGRGGGGGDRTNGAATQGGPTNPRSTIAQQPKRPKMEDAQPKPEGGVDVRQMYSTAAGDAQPKPFSELKDKLNKGLLDGLDKMGFEFMSPVQQQVLTQLPSLSSDCVVQAKTGTGKTVAFLLPAIQNLLAGNMPPKGKVAILVICPTRELALQISKECNGLTTCLPQKMECHTAFGGTSRASNLNAFMKGNPTVLVATPGRLDDILGEEEVRDKFSHLKTVVLDEADQMLDAGFAPAVKKILRRIPPKNDGWQGMCFSATLPKEVLDIAKIVLFPGFTHLSTVDPNEVPTHERVPQFSFSVPTVGQTFPALSALIEEEYNQSPTDFKAIVFGTTANGVGLLYDLYRHALPQFRLFELHSRMSQPARTRTTKDFKEASSGILFASDVVGRGMDFPNVGLVIQVGLPSSTDQYVHRVGRTARAGKDGRAVLLLFQQESFFPRINKTLPIKPYTVDIVSRLAPHQATIDRAFANVDEASKSKAYQAFLGYNKTFVKKLQISTADLVRLANDYARSMGCPEPPMLEKSTVGKMGLKGVPGLRIGSRRD